MRVIFNCSPENMERAHIVIFREMQDDWQRRYDRPGWGWHFYEGGVRFFVRGIKNGLSITEAPVKR